MLLKLFYHGFMTLFGNLFVQIEWFISKVFNQKNIVFWAFLSILFYWSESSCATNEEEKINLFFLLLRIFLIMSKINWKCLRFCFWKLLESSMQIRFCKFDFDQSFKSISEVFCLWMFFKNVSQVYIFD